MHYDPRFVYYLLHYVHVAVLEMEVEDIDKHVYQYSQVWMIFIKLMAEEISRHSIYKGQYMILGE